MKRSEIILCIASELVCDLTNFMPFDKAQELAEIVLNRIEKEGMCPVIMDDDGTIESLHWEKE